MDLVDAISSNLTATSAVELSLNPAFRRKYPSLFDGIENFFKPQPPSPDQAGQPDSQTLLRARRQAHEKDMTRLLAATLPPLAKRAYHLLVLDVTPNPRPFAATLADRVITHAPNAIKGNRPITIGHPYSVLAYIPEKATPEQPKWVVPLSVRRVDSESLETVVGAEQTKNVLEDSGLPFHNQLCVKVSDSKYSARPHVQQTAALPHLVDIVRSAGNRAFYQEPVALSADSTRPAHHPTWYGNKFVLPDPTTWPTPTETATMNTVTKKGRALTLTIQCWDEMRMRDKNGMTLHDKPFRLLRVSCHDDQGQLVFKRPIWLLAFGQRRHELALTDIVEAYLQRYDIEHFFRFGKQKLLLTAFQTSNVESEENWWQIVMLAYAQLWAARELVQQAPRPWERYLPPKTTLCATPSATQRDFGRLIQQFGTPAKSPKPRGYSDGRKKGAQMPPKNRQPVIKKSKKALSPP
jgi:hypothetical protein